MSRKLVAPSVQLAVRYAVITPQRRPVEHLETGTAIEEGADPESISERELGLQRTFPSRDRTPDRFFGFGHDNVPGGLIDVDDRA